MEVVVLPTVEDGAELVTDAIARLLHRTPSAVLGLATGSSPLHVYRRLVDRSRRGEVRFARARAFLLDGGHVPAEPLGLGARAVQRVVLLS